MLAETGLQTLEGVLAGDYFRLREFIRLLSDGLSMKLLHPSPFPHLALSLPPTIHLQVDLVFYRLLTSLSSSPLPPPRT